MKLKHLIYWLICLVVIIVGGQHMYRQTHPTANQHVTKTTAKVTANDKMRTPIDWQQSSEVVPYPDLSQVKNLWVKVSLKGNRTYLYDGNQVIYTMYSSGGVYQKDKTGKLKSTTPTGTFYVQNERGEHFFNQKLNEGANYYVSWLNHGEYLFHSVPTKADGSYNLTEAKKLGKSTGSHGCIRLSVPDAKWMMENLPEGTKVVIADN